MNVRYQLLLVVFGFLAVVAFFCLIFKIEKSVDVHLNPYEKAYEEETVSTKHSITIRVGKTYQITSSTKLTWTSSNEEVATVRTKSKETVINALAEGTSTVTGVNKNGNVVVEVEIQVEKEDEITYVWKKYLYSVTRAYTTKFSSIYNIGRVIFDGSSNRNYYVFNNFGIDHVNGKFYGINGAFRTPQNMNALTKSARNKGPGTLYIVGNVKGNSCVKYQEYLSCWACNIGTSDYKVYFFGHATNYYCCQTYFIGGYLELIVSTAAYSIGSDTGLYVTSSSPTAYPSNGYQGGYWYVLQGVE